MSGVSGHSAVMSRGEAGHHSRGSTVYVCDCVFTGKATYIEATSTNARRGR
jgi:hypothetical protein